MQFIRNIRFTITLNLHQGDIAFRAYSLQYADLIPVAATLALFLDAVVQCVKKAP